MTNKKEKQDQTLEPLKRSFNAIASTPDGIAVLRYLMRSCGFGKSSAVMNPTTYEINTVGTVWNEARKDVYLGIRKFLDNDKLINVEFKED